jgi:hypothetical protein
VGARGRTARAGPELEVPQRGMRSWIAAGSLERLGAKVEELSERGRRLGTGPIELRELEHRDGEVLVELSGAPPRLEGWEVVGRLEHLDGGPGRVSFAAPGLLRRLVGGRALV